MGRRSRDEGALPQQAQQLDEFVLGEVTEWLFQMRAAMPPFVVADVSAVLSGALAKSAQVHMNDDHDAALAVLASTFLAVFTGTTSRPPELSHPSA